jgi:hypothetical protein|nr:hypothetical protein [Kofleriaceae bacterium]
MIKLAAAATVFAMVTAGVQVARADQCAWVTKDQADAAAKIVHGADHHNVAYFCKPCGDAGPTKDIAQTVDVKHVKEAFYTLVINHKEVDLAYVYYSAGSGPYRNLGIGAKCKVVEVPDTIAVK